MNNKILKKLNRYRHDLNRNIEVNKGIHPFILDKLINQYMQKIPQEIIILLQMNLKKDEY